MTLWIIFAVMTAAALFAVLWPLGRKPSEHGVGSDRLVYQDQLKEIDRDRAVGLIGDTEAESARIEISRRLLAAVDAERAAPEQSGAVPWRTRRFLWPRAKRVEYALGRGLCRFATIANTGRNSSRPSRCAKSPAAVRNCRACAPIAAAFAP